MTRITVAANEEEFDRILAWRIVEQMISGPKAVVGLSTGQTPMNAYANIARIFRACPFDLSGVTVFNVDQVTNVPRESPFSCYDMLKSQLTGPIGLPEGNLLMPPPFSGDFGRDCAEFERELVRRGGIGLQFLGIGANGHIGFNQPGSPFEKGAWIAPLLPEFLVYKRKQLNAPPDLSLGGFTLGIRSIMQARKILLAAKGTAKAEIIRRALQGPVTTDVPASALQLHPDCEWLLDAEAAVLLDEYTC
jgi:glucosamine-6-phosphate deaminase